MAMMQGGQEASGGRREMWGPLTKTDAQRKGTSLETRLGVLMKNADTGMRTESFEEVPGPPP